MAVVLEARHHQGIGRSGGFIRAGTAIFRWQLLRAALFRLLPGRRRGYSTAPPAEAASTRTTGVLRLDITPATGLQYDVDGMFIGSSSDLGTEFEVNAGARRIEVRAEGLQAGDVRRAFRSWWNVTRRGALEPLQDSATLPRATGSTTMFVIPGCYMGNARPDPTRCRKGATSARLITR